MQIHQAVPEIFHTQKPRAKDVLPHIHRTSPQNHPPRQWRNGAVCCWYMLFAASAYHSYAAGSDGSAKRVFRPWWPLTFDVDIHTSQRVTKQVFPVTLAESRSGVPEIFEWQTKKRTKSHSTKNRTFCSSLCVVPNTTVGDKHAFLMAALHSRCGHYIFALWFLSSIFLFSLPNLSGRRLDVYHTSTHGVALVRI